MHRKSWPIAVSCTLFCALAWSGSPALAQQPGQPAPRIAALAGMPAATTAGPELLKAREDAARAAYEANVKRLELASGFDRHVIETQHTWSLLWAEAAAASAGTDPERRKAMDGHVARMTSLRDTARLREKVDVAKDTVLAAEYFHIDAELRRAAIDGPILPGRADAVTRMRDAARGTYEVMVTAREHGLGGDINGFPSAALTELHDWSSRWMEADVALAADPAERPAAARQHVSRMERWEKVLEPRVQIDVVKANLSTMHYYRLDAQRRFKELENAAAADKAGGADKAVAPEMIRLAQELIAAANALEGPSAVQLRRLHAMHDWSRRLVELRSANAGDRAAALAEHVDRMTSLAKLFEARRDIDAGSELQAAAYFAAEARAAAGAK